MNVSHFTDPKIRAMMVFITFILREFDDIGPDLVCFRFDEANGYYVDRIAKALDGRPMLFRQTPMSVTQTKSRCDISSDTLQLIFGNINLNAKNMVGWNGRKMHVNLNSMQNGSFDDEFYTKLNVDNNQRDWPLLAWSLQNNVAQKGMNEAIWLNSFERPAFKNRFVKWPAGDSFIFYHDCQTDRSGYQIVDLELHQNILYGYRIGLYKIVAELMGAERLEFSCLHNCRSRTARPILCSQRDIRLSAKYRLTTDQFVHKASLHPDSNVFQHVSSHSATQVRYVIVVPRIVATSSSNSLKDLFLKFQVLCGIFLSIAIFVFVRIMCQRVQYCSIRNLVFDTFARSLGVGSVSWPGGATAERQLLSVISFFAILSGSIFSGVLYQGLVVQEDAQFLYNNLDEICLAGMKLYLHFDLFVGTHGTILNDTLYLA